MNAKWITPETVLDRTAVYVFDKIIETEPGAEIELNISADTRYKLYFNGEYVCEGPCQSDHWFWRYETVKIPSELIKSGKNEISAHVLYNKEDCYQTQAKRDRAALIAFGSCSFGGKTEEIVTDAGWGCTVKTNRRFTQSRGGIASQMPPVERRSDEEDIVTRAVIYKDCLLESGCLTQYGLFDFYKLTKRTIKLLKPEEPRQFSAVRSSGTSSELDAGIYTTAFPVFRFKGEKGGKIRFTYSECYVDASGSKVGRRRDVAEGEISGPYDEIAFTGEEQIYESYFYKAFRYVKADYPEGTVFEIGAQTYKPYFYPVEGQGKLKTSSDLINRVWNVSVNTLKCCTHETFVDCPFYEQCQYDMDTALEMMFMMRLTDDYSMPRKAVYDLARSQQPDGMLAAHYPTSFIQVIPTFSLYWILMLRDYVTYSGDLDTAADLMSTADGVLSAFERIKDKKGLVGATPYWHYTDWVPGWERGVPEHGTKEPLTISSMIYACALGKAASLAEEIGRKGLAREYLERKSDMIRAINSNCYDDEKQLYTDVPGYGNYSEHTAVWAVLSDCVTGEKASSLIRRSFESDVSRASFSFNYYTFRAIEKTGLYNEYSERIFAGWYKMLEIGCTTWCENPDSPRSECHAWSSAPIYEYSAVLLGVRPLKTGFSEVDISPMLSAADEISGSVPTPLGTIYISWKKKNGAFEFKAKLPDGMKGYLTLGDKNKEVVYGATELLLCI